MTIDWNAFSPWSSLAGGALIGLAASLFVLINGRIAGVSGIVGGLLRPAKHDVGWRIAFVAGMVGAPALCAWVGARPVVHIAAGPVMLVIAGLLVGIGTRYGSGCTSGHGVCGIARLSPRSLAATAVFMATGFMTVFVVRHLLQL